MAKIEVTQSDFTGQQVPKEREHEVVRVVVHEHPDMAYGPVELEALPEEIGDLAKLALKVVEVEVHQPGGDAPTHLLLDPRQFNKLATGERKMPDILADAPLVAQRKVGRAAAGAARRDYATLEWAGAPHKGKTTEQEKRLVRDNLDAVNSRLQAQGLRTVDLGNPEHVERYGLQALAGQAAQSAAQ